MAGTAVPVFLYSNNPGTTVAANGYNGGAATGDAPASLTAETWTMTSSSDFTPVDSSATPPTQFAIADSAAPSETIWVTNMSGAGNNTWNVTRGEEGTTPVTHAAGAAFYQVVTAGWLNALTAGSGVFFGSQSAPSQPLYGAYLVGRSGSLDQYSADGNVYPVGQQFIQTTSATTGGTGTASQSITGLAAALGVSVYVLEIYIPWTPTGTIGSTTTFGFSASGGLALSAISMGGHCMSGDSTVDEGTYGYVTSTTLSDSMWTGSTHAGTAGYGFMRIWGTLTVSTAGTLQVVFANTTSADTVTIGAGASILVRPNN